MFFRGFFPHSEKEKCALGVNTKGNNGGCCKYCKDCKLVSKNEFLQNLQINKSEITNRA